MIAQYIFDKSELDLQVIKMEIKDIYGTSTTKEQDKPIMVDFCSTLMKDYLIQSLKNFNRVNIMRAS